MTLSDIWIYLKKQSIHWFVIICAATVEIGYIEGGHTLL